MLRDVIASIFYATTKEAKANHVMNDELLLVTQKIKKDRSLVSVFPTIICSSLIQ